MKKLIKVALTGAMILGLVGCGNKTTSSSETKGLSEWHTYQIQASEMETFKIHYSQGAVDLGPLSNCVDGLLTHDTNGKLMPQLATKWEKNDDATEWTFYLTDKSVWVDVDGNEKGKVTAEDFITGLEYVLNYEKNSGMNSSMAIEMIKGAEEYYELSTEKPEECTREKFLEMVGIEAVDDYTLKYTMKAPKPYFDSLATYATLYPLSQAALDEYGDKYGTDNTTIYYNGPYIMSTYENKSNKAFTPNETWYGTDKRFDKVTVQMVEDQAMAWSLFQSGEIDNITLSEDALIEIYKQGEGSEWYDYLVEAKPTKYAYQVHFNYDSKNEDGTLETNWNTAVANKNFRLAWYYGIEWTDYMKRLNSINPGNCVNDFYTVQNLVFLEDGTEYTDLVAEELGYKTEKNSTAVHARLDADKAAEAIDAAKKELTAAGVQLPVTCYYTYAAGNAVAADTAKIFQQVVNEALEGLVDVQFRTYTSSAAQEIRKPDLFSVWISGWGADYGDPINFLGQESDSDDAIYMGLFSNLTAEIDPDYGKFNDMLDEADAITDLDARYKAFAKAEAYFIENAWTIPLYQVVSWEITRVNDYSKVDAAYGIQASRYLNWETTTEKAYTTAEYEAFKAAK